MADYRSLKLTRLEIEMLSHAMTIAGEDGSLFNVNPDKDGQPSVVDMEGYERIARKLRDALNQMRDES